MKTIITEALKKINNHDFYWRMADGSYDRNYNNAKASMQSFQALIAQIANPDIKNALRNLWILDHDQAVEQINGRSLDRYNERKAELMEVLA